MDGFLLVPIILPMMAGALLVILAFREQLAEVRNAGNGKKEEYNESKKGVTSENHSKTGRGNWLFLYVSIVMGFSVVSALAIVWTGERAITLFRLVDGLPVMFRVDALGRLFVTVTSIVWLAATMYAFVYMKKEHKQKRYFGFWLLLYGVLAGIDFSGNLITMYLFYELMTLVSVPLVLHNGTKEAIMAALKYLFYSLCGAYGGLFGVFFLYRYCDSLAFAPGGSLNPAAVQGHEEILLLAVFAMLIGFGAKAGMLPLHAWLPAAHPVAPSPASAVLSAVIVKSGVLAVIRGVFYVVGAEFLRGTWVQYSWMALALLTVFMGSLLAFREQGFKKRLAYSTVSQVSYILFGLALLTQGAMTGSLLHVVVHAFVKCGLFLTAGIFLQCFGYTKVGQLSGTGKKMPGLMWCYMILSLALIGIPPTGGFISKWYLAEGALQSRTGIFAWLGPAVLLVSALLTAGYLLPVALRGFFPGGQEDFARELLTTEGKVNLPGDMEEARKGNFPDSIEEARESDLPGNIGESRRKILQLAGQEGRRKSASLPGSMEETGGKVPRQADPEESGEAVRPQRKLPGRACPMGMVPPMGMLLPIAVLAALALIVGILPNMLIEYAEKIAASVL